MRAFTLFEDCREARFIARPNRFTLHLELSGRKVSAYLPNPGGLEEYMVEGGVFYVTASRSGRLPFRAFAALRGGFPVLLDNAGIKDLAEFLFREKERTVGGTRRPEIKNCTLCHKGVALYPGTPATGASRHMGGFTPPTVFLVTHGGVELFMPNFHVDREFAEDVLARRSGGEDHCGRVAQDPRLLAFRVPLTDPVTVDMDGAVAVPIDWERVRANCTKAGSYVLVLRNDEERRLRIGRLGLVRFREGYYAYVGSALSSLDARVARHLRRRKHSFWHIDAIAPAPMPVVRAFPIRRADRIEGELASRVEKVCDSPVGGFGATDSAEDSHLFYFSRPPHRLRSFHDVILDFRTFTESVAFPGETR